MKDVKSILCEIEVVKGQIESLQKLARTNGWKGEKSIWDCLSPPLVFYYGQYRGKLKGLEIVKSILNEQRSKEC